MFWAHGTSGVESIFLYCDICALVEIIRKCPFLMWKLTMRVPCPVCSFPGCFWYQLELRDEVLGGMADEVDDVADGEGSSD